MTPARGSDNVSSLFFGVDDACSKNKENEFHFTLSLSSHISLSLHFAFAH